MSATFEPLIDEKQAAQFLGGLHPKTVQRMARRGEIPAIRIGRYWRYRASDLNRWIELKSSGQLSTRVNENQGRIRMFTREKYQHGSLRREKRKHGADVWIFR